MPGYTALSEDHYCRRCEQPVRLIYDSGSTLIAWKCDTCDNITGKDLNDPRLLIAA